jgi:hypothetical protein
MPIKINPKVEYAKITLQGSLATQTKEIKATILIDSDQDIEEVLKNAGSEGFSFKLNLDPLIEQTCPVCDGKFYPELRGKRKQIYDKPACNAKAYRERKKNII